MEQETKTSLRRVTFDSFDPESMEQTLQQSQLEHTLLDGGRFSGQLTQGATADTRIDYGGYDLPVLAVGVLAPDRISLGFILLAPEACSFNSQAVNQGDLMLYSENEEIHARLCPGIRWIAIQMDRSLCAGVGLEMPEKVSAKLTSDGPTISHLQGLLAPSLQLISSVGDGDRVASPVICRAMDDVRDGMLSALAANQANWHRQSFARPNQRLVNRMRLVRRAEDYLEAHLDEPTTVADLCRELGYPIHALERAFVGVLGTTPKRFLNQRRMARLRRVLLASDADALSVTEAMLSCGLYHTGRAAGVYRRFFGESPNETLTRS
jgi:AraC-like DNA-binding protein